MMAAMARRSAFAIVVALACAGACGPVAYIHQVTFGADDAVEAARKAGAEKYSPYWFTRATQYLEMARIVAGHADYQGANKFGKLSEEAAEHAREEATDPAKRPTNPMETAPAKDGAVAPAKDAAVAPAKEAPAKTAPAKAAPAIAPAKEAP